MAQRLSTSFVNTNIPGAIPNLTVKSTPVGIGSTGDIILIGEAAGGADFSVEDVKNNFYTPSQLSNVIAKYIKGPIVDAVKSLTAPSNDSDIQGSTGKIYIIKTNAGAKASAIVTASPAGTYGTFSSKNYGADGNKYSFAVTQSQDEVAPSLQSSALTIGDGSIFNGVSFSVRLNGEAVTVVTLSATSTDHDSAAKLAAEIALQLPAGMSCAAAVGVDAIIFSVDADADANGKGWSKSFELIDSTPGDLVALGVVEGLTVSSQEAAVEVNIVRQDTNVNETFEAIADVALLIGYVGTTATITIVGSSLTTTVTGGAGANLTVDMSQYVTMNDLASFINSQAGYTCSAVAASGQLNPVTILDDVTTVGICSTSASLTAGRIKRALYNYKLKVAQSLVLDFVATAVAGIPAENAKTFLASGVKGSTTSANIVSAILAAKTIKANFVVPLFSRDATADIVDGLTESGSTYTIDAVNFAVKSHVLEMSTPKLKRFRVAMLSKWDSYANSKIHAQTIAHYRAVVCMQKSSQVNSEGVITSFLPWHSSVIAAGMQSAGFYKALANKYANVISIVDPTGFDSGDLDQLEDAIDSGLMIMSQDSDGNKWVVDQTSYGFDTNFVYNSLQAVYTADVLQVNLADSLQKQFVGKSTADIDAATVLSFVSKKMDEFKKLKIISGSDDAPLGYRNVKINLAAPTISVSLEVKLTTAILFIPIEIEVSQVQSSASL